LYTIGTTVHEPSIKKPSSAGYFRRKTLRHREQARSDRGYGAEENLGSSHKIHVGASLLAKAVVAAKKNPSLSCFG
jgi:hypothetical protein